MADPSATVVTAPNRDLALLAPRFQRALLMVLHGLWTKGFDPVVYEAFRSNGRQQWLYAQGRTRPGSIVTNARDAMHGWHFFGLAADVISRSGGWDYPSGWYAALSALCTQYGLAWGGNWTSIKDYPHVQWGAMPASPTDEHRALYAKALALTNDPYDGRLAVWRAAAAV